MEHNKTILGLAILSMFVILIAAISISTSEAFSNEIKKPSSGLAYKIRKPQQAMVVSIPKTSAKSKVKKIKKSNKIVIKLGNKEKIHYNNFNSCVGNCNSKLALVPSSHQFVNGFAN